MGALVVLQIKPIRGEVQIYCGTDCYIEKGCGLFDGWCCERDVNCNVVGIATLSIILV